MNAETQGRQGADRDAGKEGVAMTVRPCASGCGKPLSARMSTPSSNASTRITEASSPLTRTAGSGVQGRCGRTGRRSCDTYLTSVSKCYGAPTKATPSGWNAGLTAPARTAPPSTCAASSSGASRTDGSHGRGSTWRTWSSEGLTSTKRLVTGKHPGFRLSARRDEAGPVIDELRFSPARPRARSGPSRVVSTEAGLAGNRPAATSYFALCLCVTGCPGPEPGLRRSPALCFPTP